MHTIHFNSAVVGAVMAASLACTATVANATATPLNGALDRTVQPIPSVTISPGLGTLFVVPWKPRPSRAA